MRLEIKQGFKGLKKIESEWNQLFNKLTKPFYSQSVIWHKAYLSNLVNDINSCYYFCIYKGSNLIAIFPLENIRHKFYLLSFNTLSFSNHSHFGLNTIIVNELENTQIIFEFLYQSLKKEKTIKWDLIYLKRVLEDTQASLCRIQNSKRIAQSISRPCNTLPLQNYDDIYKKFSKNFKSKLRNRRNKITKMDNAEYFSTRKIEKLDVYLEHFLNVEASGWKGSKGEASAIKLNNKLHNFYQDIMKGFSKYKQIEINLLMINDKPIAGQFVLIIGSTVFGLKMGYDEDFKSLSPGIVLFDHKLQEYANNQDLSILNFLTDASWQSIWKPEKILSYNICNCKSLSIAIYLKLIFWLKDHIKEIKNR